MRGGGGRGQRPAAERHAGKAAPSDGQARRQARCKRGARAAACRTCLVLAFFKVEVVVKGVVKLIIRVFLEGSGCRLLLVNVRSAPLSSGQAWQQAKCS